MLLCVQSVFTSTVSNTPKKTILTKALGTPRPSPRLRSVVSFSENVWSSANATTAHFFSTSGATDATIVTKLVCRGYGGYRARSTGPVGAHRTRPSAAAHAPRSHTQTFPRGRQSRKPSSKARPEKRSAARQLLSS